jgi:TatD DNase family protein
MRLVDSHCHLDFAEFDADRDALFTRMTEAGVMAFLQIAMAQPGFERFDRAVEIVAAGHAAAADSPQAFLAVGIHPHDSGAAEALLATGDDSLFARVEALVRAGEAVGVGECGLEYHYDVGPKAMQRRWFERHLDLCVALDKPIIIHSRDAFEDTLAIVQPYAPKLRGVMHCFSYGPDEAAAFVEAGLHISIPGVVTFKNGERTREAAATVPLDRLLVETDAPFLAPIPYRGKRNEPAFVAATAAKVAEVRGLDPSALAAATTSNFERLFGLGV